MLRVVLNKEMRRNAHGTSSHFEVLVTENRGRSQKKEPKGSKQYNRSKSKSRETWHIVVTKHGTFRETVFFGKRRTRIRKGSRRRNIMTMIIALLLLFVMMILLFSVTMIQLILYQMRACG